LISQRKKDHISLALKSNDRLAVGGGFDRYEFEHNALPEIDFESVDASVNFLNRKLKLPLMISSITGGDEDGNINAKLAEIAQSFGLGMAVGSQRIALEKPEFEGSFKVRRYAPNILLFANLGAVQLNYGYSIDECKRAVELIEADGLILHLNPLQEVFQSNGNTNFSGLLKKIENVCSSISRPVIVKEVGYGISENVAKKLRNAGVFAVEIGGSGSVSWPDIESERSNEPIIKKAAKAFEDWGLSTAEQLEAIAKIKGDMEIIAGGGIKTGVDIAKAVVLGAKICGNATDFLRKIAVSQSECEVFIKTLAFELKTTMFCVGCQNIDELRSTKLNRRSQK
jgi:isopentenyl-diphosphate delta-isomerase